MPEYLDIFDEAGKPTGQTEEKSIVHELGLWHKVVHIWIINSNNELLLRLRWPDISPKFANIWDIPSSGHIESGETAIQAAIRETMEETGISIKEKDLKFLFAFKKIDFVAGREKQNNEFVDVFLVNIDLTSDTVITDGRESVVKYFPLQYLKNMNQEQMIKNKIYEQPYYEILFKALENKEEL